ncbi:uracil-xanthine permease family protein [Suttonella sp. R2A3]|uniref:uracil-xanthine permease family protein n=1 Tax=Suttonella sp. R2A3 TaxID=2908648 RepID=UPI001F1E0DD7|nr:uracil-xanthine permease family protein [Suttonella sp. R2A3]UJF23646.1 uracil-xanthine permease family protein [Suttonella sp. R2A3]
MTRVSFKEILVGIQMLFVAFGALVLVPLLTGISPSVALLSAGIGTLFFQWFTGFSVPIFLGSSFAFIAPLTIAIDQWGLAATQGGILAVAAVYLVLALLIRVLGVGFIQRVFPPIVVAPVIMVIGLSLAPVAANMAMGLTGDGSVELVSKAPAMITAFIALLATIIVALYTKGLTRMLAVFAGIVAGYVAAFALGITDFSAVQQAKWFAAPPVTLPSFHFEAMLFLIPIAIAPAIEHIGDVAVISEVCEKDFFKKPGLHRTMAGDGVAIAIASMLGGPPVTTYSEVTGAVSITGAKQARIMIYAAFTAIILAFSGKLAAFLSNMPTPIMGGIMMLLFGTIAAMGARSLLDSRTDLSSERSVIIIAVTLVIGLGNVVIQLGPINLQGIGLSAICAIVLNLILPHRQKSA